MNGPTLAEFFAQPDEDEVVTPEILRSQLRRRIAIRPLRDPE